MLNLAACRRLEEDNGQTGNYSGRPDRTLGQFQRPPILCNRQSITPHYTTGVAGEMVITTVFSVHSSELCEARAVVSSHFLLHGHVRISACLISVVFFRFNLSG